MFNLNFEDPTTTSAFLRTLKNGHFFKVGVLFIFFHLEGSKMRPLFFDMLCFGGFIIDCNFFQTCTFAEFGIIKILGLRSQDIVLNHKIRNVEN